MKYQVGDKIRNIKLYQLWNDEFELTITKIDSKIHFNYINLNTHLSGTCDYYPETVDGWIKEHKAIIIKHYLDDELFTL